MKSASTVRFFNHGEFYSLHEEDAVLAADQIFNTSIVKYMGAVPKVKYMTVSPTNFEKLVRELLLVKQYRVEVYVKQSQGRNVDWVLEYKGSPGNLQQFEELLFDKEDMVINAVVIGIKIGKGNILGVSCLNLTESTFSVTEFVDNDFYTELEALMAQLSPKECVIPAGESVELIRLKKLLERSCVLVQTSKASDFNTNDIEQDLNRLLFFASNQQRNVAALKEYSLTEAMGSLQAVIKHLDLMGDDQNFNQFKLASLDSKRYVRLDYAAINALNLLNKPGVIPANKFETVYGVLNMCSSQQGKRLLERWMKQPLQDLNLLSERLDVVEVLVNDSETRTTLSTCSLNKIPDLMLLSKKLGGKKATLHDCYRAYQAIQAAPFLVGVLRNVDNASVRALLIDPLGEALSDLEKYQSMIEQTLDLDLVDRGEYFIKPSFDDHLNELYINKKSVEEKIQRVYSKAANDLNLERGKTIKMDCNDQHGYFFRVTLKEEPVLRSNKNYKIIDAVKGGVRFTNSKMDELNKEYTKINEEYGKVQTTVVKDILEVAGGYCNSLRNLNFCIATVDVLVAFANAATAAPIPYVRPKLLPSGTGVINLKKARHPCLERQDDVNFIANDVDFVQGEKNFFIVTGPNMGGKSTYMRTVGVSVFMAHIGSFVPCESAEISIVDCILARVGADDCETKGLSTFMLEMVESCGIVRSATKNSLVIIDELGRGTSTYDGCGIAWSIAEFLVKEAKSFTLFATHYHEITRLEDQLSTVVNLHVTALITDKHITPLYEVKEGVCDKSYGIHCARIANFPEDVVNFAKDHQNQLEDAAGMKYIKEFDVSVKRKIIEEGDILISDVLSGFKSINTKEIADEELLQMAKRMKTDLETRNNLFIKGLLEK